MARSIVWLDGIDAADLGLTVVGSGIPGSMDGPQVSHGTVAVPGRWGAVRTGVRSADGAYVVTVTADVNAGTPGALAGALDVVKGALGGRVITVRTAYQPDREWSGVLGALQVEPWSSWLDGRVTVTLPVVCDSPLASALSGTIVGFGATPTPIPLGTEASTPVVRLIGPATNPVLIYRDHRGVERSRFGLTGVLGASDYAAVDMRSHGIAVSLAGVASDALGWRTSGRYFALDPIDGDRAAGAWPTLEVTAGAGLVLYTEQFR